MKDQLDQEHNRKRLIVKILQMYYLENETQEEIARKQSISRATVVRLLAEGREQGLVQITIRDPLLESFAFEAALKTAYGLSQVIVSETVADDAEKLKENLGALAAEYILGRMHDGMTLAVSAGSTLHAVSQNLAPFKGKEASVVSLHGGCNEYSTINPDDIARSFAERLGARCFYLNAPAFTESEQKRDALLAEPRIQAVLNRIRGSHIAIVGIGDLSSHTLVVKSQLPDGESMIGEVLDRGAVGELLGHYFDEDGRTIACEMDKRIVGIDIHELRRIPSIVAIAGGTAKVGAIRSVLRSGYCNVLITDIATARALLQQSPAAPVDAVPRAGVRKHQPTRARNSSSATGGARGRSRRT